MKLISVKPTPADSAKKLVATFCKCKGESKCADKDKIRIAFGSKGSSTYSEGASEKTKDAYIARHKVLENFDKIGPASLSRYILWSRKSIVEGIKEFKRHFKC